MDSNQIGSLYSPAGGQKLHRMMRLILLMSSNRSAGWVCKTHRAGGAETCLNKNHDRKAVRQDEQQEYINASPNCEHLLPRSSSGMECTDG